MRQMMTLLVAGSNKRYVAGRHLLRAGLWSRAGMKSIENQKATFGNFGGGSNWRESFPRCKSTRTACAGEASRYICVRIPSRTTFASAGLSAAACRTGEAISDATSGEMKSFPMPVPRASTPESAWFWVGVEFSPVTGMRFCVNFPAAPSAESNPWRREGPSQLRLQRQVDRAARRRRLLVSLWIQP
jgi:hypothetical protein